jgi:hypothetical protein
MNNRQPFQYTLLVLLIPLVLVAFLATVIYTFRVGTIVPTPTPSVSPTTTSPSSTPVAESEARYPDQAYITDGIIIFGVIIVAIVLFGVAHGNRVAIRGLPKPGRK